MEYLIEKAKNGAENAISFKIKDGILISQTMLNPNQKSSKAILKKIGYVPRIVSWLPTDIIKNNGFMVVIKNGELRVTMSDLEYQTEAKDGFYVAFLENQKIELFYDQGNSSPGNQNVAFA